MKPYLIFGAALTLAALTSCTSVPRDSSRDLQPVHTSQQTNPSLTEYQWTLDRAVDAAGATDIIWTRPANGGGPAVLTFGDRILTVSGLCNILNASYLLDGPRIQIGQVTSTMRSCPDESLMRYEQAFSQRLPQAAAWHITALDGQQGQPRLTLRFQDNTQWVLSGTATPETTYGSPGETLFLEVAPQLTPCSDPLVPNRQCLNVRTVHYDAAGLKQGYGAWGPFYGHIDGYTHQPGVRNVLRVKRYTRQNPPADASEFAYVLDMVVESQAMPVVR